MPLDPHRARRQAAELDEDITSLIDDFMAQLADVWGALRRRIVQLVQQLQDEGGRVRSTAVNLGVARAAAQELQRALEEAGYGALIATALDEMGQLATYQGLGQTIVRRVQRESAWSADTLQAFRQLKLNELIEVTAGVQRQVEQILLRGIVGAQPRDVLLNELLDALEVTLPQARTIYDTALSEFSRIAVTSTATGAPDEAFLYSGPIDALIRPFCAERVGKVYTRTAIDAMDNGQLDNVLLTGGGYNCRHTWLPLDTDDPLADKAGTGDPIDEQITADLDRAMAAKARLKAEKRKARGV